MAEFDTIIRGGTVVDGTGGPARVTDVVLPFPFADGFSVRIKRFIICHFRA